MVGSALHRRLEGCWEGECLDADVDLRDQLRTEKMMHDIGPDCVMHFAARDRKSVV